MVAQLYLIFRLSYETILTFSGLSDTILKWEFKGLSNEKIQTPFTTNKILSPKPVLYNSRIKLKF